MSPVAHPHPPEVVVFDLGKVLLDFDYGRVAQRLAPASNKSPSEFQSALDQSPLLHRYESGRMDTPDFFQAIREVTGFKGGFELFQEAFADIFTPVETMIGLHASIRSRGIPTFIFSNTNEIAVRHIRTRYPFFNGFDGYVFSYEAGALKPDPSIYDAVESLTQRNGPAILYIDDRLENIQTARTRHWQTIHHQQPDDTRRIVNAAL